MGFSHSWIALKSADKAGLLDALGLEEVGPGDLNDALNGFGLAELPDGWLLVLCNDFEFPTRSPLADLSQRGDVLSCAIEEHVMCSDAQGFSGGAATWRVAHDPSKGIKHLQVDGEPPSFVRVRDEAFAEQDEADHKKQGVDYVFDVPPLVAKTVCGFELGRSAPNFVVLRPLGRPDAKPDRGDRTPGFLQRLFGRR